MYYCHMGVNRIEKDDIMPRIARKYLDTSFLHVLVQGMPPMALNGKSIEKKKHL